MNNVRFEAGTITIAGKSYNVILEPIDKVPEEIVAKSTNSDESGSNAPSEVNQGSFGGGKAKKAKGTRKLSPYMKFAQEARVKILKSNPELKSDIPGMGRRIGEMWRGLSAAEKARY